MKRPSKKENHNLLLRLDNDIIKQCDREKLSGIAGELSLGIRNFTLFQKFSSFKWPAWINSITDVKNPSFHNITPYLLSNYNYRDHVLIPNSSDYIRIDLSGMVSPVNEHWSVEFWISGNERFFRPQENAASVIQSMDLKSFLLNTRWEEKNFRFSEDIYNIEHSEKKIKETVIDLSLVQHKSNIPHKLFVVIRPYNLHSIGNVKSIEYNNKSRTAKINKRERLYLENKPEYILAGNGITGDITSFIHANEVNHINCEFGMATLAFGYNVNRGENKYQIRLNTGNEKTYKPVKINYQVKKNEYIDNCRLRNLNGIKLSFPDNKFRDWFEGARISALNHLDMELSYLNKQDNPSLKPLFYLSLGYNRMGKFSDSKRMIEFAAGVINRNNKPDFAKVINTCYYIHCVADYFKLSRDIDYLQVKYKSLRLAAGIINQYTSGIKKNKIGHSLNSIDYYLIPEYHLFDIILIASALSGFSYLSRCLGIFNDEIKFRKESERLEEIFLNKLESLTNHFSENDTDDNKEKNKPDIAVPLQGNEHFAYDIFGGFPFNLGVLTSDRLKKIAGDISGKFSGNPIFFKSLGACDTLFSIIFAVNLLLLKDNRALSIIEKLFESGKQRYVLPEYTNPKTGHGTIGRGDSGSAISAFFILLRSVIFMDSQDRLEIFPLPSKEWFSEGSEIIIENSPSIFGMVNFKCVSTRNELQLYFCDIPKFIPPEIKINFPFPTRIKQEDDFIIKKETGNSYLIHGWPGMIRFKKK